MGAPQNVTPIKSKITRQTDLATGEAREVLVEEEAEPGKPVRKRKRTGERKVFSLMDNNVMARLEMSALQWRIVFQIIADTNRERGYAKVTGAEIAEALHSHQPTINDLMQDLMKRNIVFKIGYGRYRVNSWLVFRGEVRDWDDMTEKDPEPIYTKEQS